MTQVSVYSARGILVESQTAATWLYGNILGAQHILPVQLPQLSEHLHDHDPDQVALLPADPQATRAISQGCWQIPRRSRLCLRGVRFWWLRRVLGRGHDGVAESTQRSWRDFTYILWSYSPATFTYSPGMAASSSTTTWPLLLLPFSKLGALA